MAGVLGETGVAEPGIRPLPLSREQKMWAESELVGLSEQESPQNGGGSEGLK